MTGVAEVRCGIDYQGGVAGAIGDRVGIDVLAWRSCATIDDISTGAPEWPRPGGGITIRWDLPESCQEGEAAVAGYFYIGAYSADVLRLAAEPVSGIAALRNCQSEFVALDAGRDLGSAAFSSGGTENGCNPCDIACDGMPVLPSTWGGIKSLLD